MRAQSTLHSIFSRFFQDFPSLKPFFFQTLLTALVLARRCSAGDKLVLYIKKIYEN